METQPQPECPFHVGQIVYMFLPSNGKFDKQVVARIDEDGHAYIQDKYCTDGTHADPKLWRTSKKWAVLAMAKYSAETVLTYSDYIDACRKMLAELEKGGQNGI